MSGWHTGARATWLSVVLLAATGLLAGAGTVRWPRDAAEWAGCVALAAAATALALKPLETGRGRKSSAAAVPAAMLALLFDPFVAGVAGALAAGAAQVAARRPWAVGLYNVAQRALAVGAAGHAVGQSVAIGLPFAAGALVAVLAYFLVNAGAVVAISAARRRVAWWTVAVEVLRGETLGEIGLLSLGALLAVLLDAAPAALPLLALPLWAAWRLLSDAGATWRLNQRLADAVARQRRFLADAAHELRTPVASLRAQLEATRAGLRREAAGARDAAAFDVNLEEQLETMTQACARLSGLVADLMTLARADEGGTLAAEPVDLEDVLLDVYREVLPFAGGVQLRLNVDADAGGGPEVLGDRERLRQMVLNLVTNAVRFTPPGGVVELRCRTEADAVVVAVADSGDGIAPEHLPRIFERFYRADSSRGRSNGGAPGGAGLGLAIARWVAESHGGSIAVRSELDRGSEFTVRLPPAAPGPAPAAAVRAAVPGPAA